MGRQVRFLWSLLLSTIPVSGTLTVAGGTSPKSEIIPNRQVLEDNMEKYKQEFNGNIPRPPHWGGYRIVPDAIEFWQGRSSRLHNRLKYENGWGIVRLAP